jgi:hypothetical protein
VIQDAAVERLDGVGQAARRPAIALTRTCIAAWVIVGEHDTAASEGRRVRDDFADREIRAAFVAAMAGDVQASRLLIDMRDPQAFTARVLLCEAPCEKVASGLDAVELQREFGTLIPHERTLRSAARDYRIELGPKRSIIVKTDQSSPAIGGWIGPR